MDKEIYAKICPMLSSCVESLGFSCIGLEFVQDEDPNILRLYIDNEKGIDLLDCESVSRVVSQYLDTVEDILPFHYLLEVTSAGLERPLFNKQDFIDYIGQNIEVIFNSQKSVVGKIIDADNSLIRLDTKSKILEFSYDKIKSAHLIFTVEKCEKKTFKKNHRKKK